FNILILPESILRALPAFSKTSGKRLEIIFINIKLTQELSAKPAGRISYWCILRPTLKLPARRLSVVPSSIRDRNALLRPEHIFRAAFGRKLKNSWYGISLHLKWE